MELWEIDLEILTQTVSGHVAMTVNLIDSQQEGIS
jgi:hypothetical protein